MGIRPYIYSTYYTVNAVVELVLSGDWPTHDNIVLYIYFFSDILLVKIVFSLARSVFYPCAIKYCTFDLYLPLIFIISFVIIYHL